MYLAHFGLAQAPFGLTPDTRFYVPRASHQQALNTLLVAIRSGEGFVKLTGEVGLGKTLICRKLLNTLGEGFVVAYIPNPAVTPMALYLLVFEELGGAADATALPETLLRLITQKLIANATVGLRTVLIVDEAQALPDDTLEAIRLLTNLETEQAKLLQVVLIGQPELDRHLERTHLRQLLQRISFSHRLEPLDYAGFLAYVEHRLKVAGAPSEDLFDADALWLLFKASRGIPRLINMLCHKSLMAAFGPGRPRVERGHALAAIADTEGVRRSWDLHLAIFAGENLGLVALALLLSLGFVYLLGYAL